MCVCMRKFAGERKVEREEYDDDDVVPFLFSGLTIKAS